jgi:acyl-CoA thioesterase-1
MQDNRKGLKTITGRISAGRWLRHCIAGIAMMLCAMSAYSAPKTLLVLGDSLSAEYGLERGQGWSMLLQQRLRENKIDATVVNSSISGDTTIGGKNRLAPLLARHKPEVVIIELGSNDALRGLQLNATRDNLSEMIAMSQKAKARVLLVGMQIPPNYGPDYTRRFAAMFKDLSAQTKSGLVPFFMQGIADKLELFQADRIHPNEQAQPILLDNVWPHLKPLIGAR